MTARITSPSCRASASGFTTITETPSPRELTGFLVSGRIIRDKKKHGHMIEYKERRSHMRHILAVCSMVKRHRLSIGAQKTESA